MPRHLSLHVRYDPLCASRQGLPMRRRALLLCLLLQATSQAAQLTPAEVSKQLTAAQRMIQQGIPDKAISKYLDPIIASYRQQHADPGEKIYSAHNMVETLIYTTMDGAASKDGGTPPPKRVTVVTGDWSDALELKAYALVELHRFDEARATLKAAIELAPLYALPWEELGNLYQNEKDWPHALEAFESAENAATLVEDDDSHRPLYARALRGKAFVYTEQGKLDESEALYRQCLTLNPDDGGAKRELAYIEGLRKQHPSAPSPE